MTEMRVDGRYREPNPDVDELAHRVIGAAIEVHRHLGPGYLVSEGYEVTPRPVDQFQCSVAQERYPAYHLVAMRLDVL